MGRQLVVKARVVTKYDDSVSWETPAHAIDGSSSVEAVVGRFRLLYVVERVVGFTFLDPNLVRNAPPLD